MLECIGNEFVEDQTARYRLVYIQLDLIQLQSDPDISMVVVSLLQVMDKTLQKDGKIDDRKILTAVGPQFI